MEKNKNKIINKTINGGFFEGKFKFANLINNTKKSEMQLFKTYEDMINKEKLYTKAYTDHLQNLEKLDEFSNFNGMVTLFKKIIMKDNIKNGNIDLSNPLLFRNYMIEKEIMPGTLRAEHIKQQTTYLRSKYFSVRDNKFISFITVSDVMKTSFVLNVVTIDSKKYNRKIAHEDYIIDNSEFKHAVRDIIYTTKKNLKRDNKIISYDNNTQNTSSRTSRTVKNSIKVKSIHSKAKSKTKSRKNEKQNEKKNELAEPTLNIFGSKKGISQLNSDVQNLLKSKKKNPLYSIQKTKSIREKEAKAKRNAEEKERALLNPPSQDEIIEAKCKLNTNNEMGCKAIPECYYDLYGNCKKSNRPPLGIAQPMQALIPAAPGMINLLDTKAI